MELTRRAFVKAATVGAALLPLGCLPAVKRQQKSPESYWRPPEVLVIDGQKRRRLHPRGITFTPKGKTMEVEFDLDKNPGRVWGVDGWRSRAGGPSEPRGLREMHLKRCVFNRGGIPFWGTRYRTIWRRGIWVELYA